LAAGPPNESSLWTAEMTADGMIQTPNAPAEAYSADNSNLMQVWRGDDNHIYLSLNHGPDLQIGTDTVGITNTLAAPRIVPYGPDDWAVFHTGIDGQIYWMPLDLATVQAAVTLGDTSILPFWQALPDTTTVPNLSPDVATAGPASQSMLVTYRSSTNNQLYSQWYGGLGNGWTLPQAVPDAFSASTPAVVWNQAFQLFIVFFRGTDNGLYVVYQPLGGPWSDVFEINNIVNINSGPSVMALSNGDMQIAARDLTGNLYYWEYYTADDTFVGPTQDSTDVNIDTPPQLVGTQGNAIWTLVSLLGYAYYKLSMKEDSLPSNLTTGDVSAKRAAFARALTSAATS